ncbi:MAG: alanine racemase [Candidatus Gastranaerophilales bacterium]|nr:alanine racemase [Candidatus Gastranaerophilales bacterium]
MKETVQERIQESGKKECQEKLRTYMRGYVEVDLDKIVSNMRHLKANLPKDTRLMAVVKADGYGHGSVPIARVLEPLDFVYGFAVATAEEAHILRMAKIEKPILILGYTFPYSYEQLVREEVRLTVFRTDTIEALARAAGAVGKCAKVHVKVDTGMSRIGISPDEEGLSFVGRLLRENAIEVEGIFTHFARADETDKGAAKRQFAIFQRFVERIEKTFGVSIPMRHCANSAAIMELPKMGLNMARAGIALYGLYPSAEVSKGSVSLAAALSLYSHVVYIKTIHAGQSVSYGGTFTAERAMRVATIPLGYGDGYPRGLSGKGSVLIRGKKAAILGRVCMDQFMVDVTDIPDAAEGDLVTLIGADGGERIDVEWLGELSGRFHYELVCDLGKRLPRVYLRHGEPVLTADYEQE